MAEKSKVKITVAKKLDARDIFGNQMPETSDAFQGPICTLWEEGKKFIVQEDGRMPSDFCSWAWYDIHRDLSVLRFGGNFLWMKEPGVGFVSCTDGLRPVIFKLERIK
jgi:uncharacterized repeat protein (TIGR04076 family)